MFSKLLPLAVGCVWAVVVHAQPTTPAPTSGQPFSPRYAISPDNLPAASTGAGFVEPVTPLSLSQAIEYVLTNNASLTVLAREVRARDGDRLQSSLRPNPELGMRVEDLRDRNRTTTLELSQLIERGGKREARISVAELGQSIATQEFLARERALRAEIEAAFRGVLAAQESQRLAQGSLDLAERVSDIAGRRVRAGKVSPVEETRAQLAQAAVRAELSAANGALAVARSRLSALWGNAMPRFEYATGSLNDESGLRPLPDMLSGLDDSPLMERARTEISRRRAVVDLERSRGVQDVRLSVGAARNNELGLTQVLFGFSIPLAINDRNQGAQLEALRRADQAQDELMALRAQLSEGLVRAYERASTAKGLVRTLELDILPGAQSAYGAATIGFELGKFTLLEILDAQRTLFQARSQYVRALTEMNEAIATMRSIVGDRKDGE